MGENTHPADPDTDRRTGATGRRPTAVATPAHNPLEAVKAPRSGASQDRLQVTYVRSTLSCPDFRTDNAGASTLPTKIATTRAAVGPWVVAIAERSGLSDRRSRSTNNTLGSAQTRPHSRNEGSAVDFALGKLGRVGRPVRPSPPRDHQNARTLKGCPSARCARPLTARTTR